MSFLAPLFLAGLGAAALPVLLHLFRNTVRRRIPFSAVRFVEAVPSRTTRRMQVEHWPLMLLRMTALCLLALAFARPWLRREATGEPEAPGRRVIVLLDTSASMQREGLWAQAVRHVDETLETLEAKDELAFATFDRRPQWHVTAQEWNALPTLAARIELVRARLHNLKPGWSATHLDTAFLTALESCAKQADPHTSTPRRTELIVISDLQAGTHLDILKDHDWPKNVTVALRAVASPQTTNASLQLVADATEGSATATAPKVRVKVSNSADATNTQFQLAWAADSASPYVPDAPIAITVPAGQSRTVLIPAPATHLPSSTTSHMSPQRLVLTGDDHSFDNTLDVLSRTKQHRTVIYHGNDRPTDTSGCRYFLDRAFPETATREVRILTLDELSTQGAAPSTLGAESNDAQHSQTPDLAVIAAPFNDAHLKTLRMALSHGSTILLLAHNASAAETFATLTQTAPLPIEEATVDGFALLVDLDFTHPAWQPFRDPQYADFSRIHIWNHRRITLPDSATAPPNLRILARYDNGAPALIEHIGAADSLDPVADAASVGSVTSVVSTSPDTARSRRWQRRPRVLLLTTTWSPKDSQLALAAKFAPFLNALLDMNPSDEIRGDYEAGEAIAWSHLASAGTNDSLTEARALSVHTPDDRRIAWVPSSEFAAATMPGIYTVFQSTDETEAAMPPGTSPLATFAVRIPPEESRTAPLPIESLTALGVPVTQVDDGASPVPASKSTANETNKPKNATPDVTAIRHEHQQRGWRWLIVAALIVLVIETAWATRLQTPPLST